jgi:heterodisulfide reductase subunit A-like polyferredoxin
MNNEKIGAVMVVGGGISGMQSALDLAEAGFKVYLVENQTAIGGTMARLDKTFPTNDCAMCTMSPRLVDTGRHLNIQVLTGAEVRSLSGEPGNFRVKLKKKARYVDLEKCTGCGDCARACPVEVTSDFDAGLAQRKAIYKFYPQATPNAFAIEKTGIPPCRAACPAGVNAQGYIQLIKTGKLMEAWQMVYRDNPFPAACGRICTHPCQTGCHRSSIDKPVNIMHLKRVAADFAYNNLGELPLPASEEAKNKKVAVVGAGPAGLSAAYQLLKKGYTVTVFEALPVAGGMMRVGIPEYRLPKKWVQLEVELLIKMGLEIRYNTGLGKDFTLQSLQDEAYQAVFLAIGAHKGTRLGVPGEELNGVMHGLDFLRSVALGEKVEVGRQVAVIGGGNTAMDCARTALRLGAENVTIVYRRTEAEITALPEEIREAKEEGIAFLMLTAPKAFHGENGRLTRMECLRNELSEPDASGRLAPIPVKGSEFFLEADTVLLAVGQKPDLPLDLPVNISRSGNITAVQETLATDLPGVFAGGDAVTGPKTVIEAVAAGKLAAESIHQYLQGLELKNTFKVSEEKVAPLRFAGEEIPRFEPEPVSCAEPVERAKNFSEVSAGYTLQQAKKEAERCLNCGVCSECLECTKVCLPAAIDHSMSDEEIELAAGAVILSPGFEPFDARLRQEFGWGIYPNVLTSIQFERMLSASGPFQGHLVRPSDKTEPKKIAFIQCIGSRDSTDKGSEYCSAVCCMYATKQAIIAQEHVPGLETAIFYIDVRAFGKDFEKYYDRARLEHGVRYEKCIVSTVRELQQEKTLRIKYRKANGKFAEEDFDLVVLSVGLRPSASAGELAGRTGIKLNEYGFCQPDEFKPGCTSKEGVFVSGAFCGPKDIPETVVESSAAAAHASCLLSTARGSLTAAKEYPPERDVSDEEPSVGVFVCNCGINIGGIINVPEVVKYAGGLRNVKYAEEFLFTCSQDNIQKIKERIIEYGLNRLVVASCTPRTHAPLFMSSMREAGLNPHLFEQANIREHSAWVHRDQPAAATEKAKELVSMSVAKACLLEPVATSFIEVNRRALVAGGGMAGITAALSLAGQGFDVYLVEKEKELGGNARNLFYTIQGNNPQVLLGRLVNQLQENPRITVLTGAEIKEVSGYVGNYRTKVKLGREIRELTHGVVIMAIGAREARPEEYMYGEHPSVLTQTELEHKIVGNELPGVKNIVMIQCVGSRQEGRPYCSRICCSHAIKNALKIKEINPAANVFILYRDVRMYGFMEKYYKKARSKGVIFIRYDLENKPSVTASGSHLTLQVNDPVLGEQVSLDADLLVLSTGVAPRSDNEKLSWLFKVALTADRFFAEAHMKLRPVDFAADGIYLCGLGHSPKLLGESIAQANAAAVRAVTLLSKDRLESLGIVATVDEDCCKGCGLCVAVCAYDARYLDRENGMIARVHEVLCQGCGACVASCPSGASQQKGFAKQQIIAMADAALG